MSFIEKYVVEPFEYATSDWSKVLIGVLLLLIPIVLSSVLLVVYLNSGPFTPLIILGIVVLVYLIVPLIIQVVINGYYIAVIKNTLEGLDTLPDWSNLGEIVKDGILYMIALFIITLLLSLPAIILFIIGVYPVLATSGSYLTYTDLWNAIAYMSIIVILLLLYLLLLAVILWVYVPLATVNFAKKGFFGFFEVVDILKKISLGYIVMLVIYFTVYFTVALILWIIGVVPVIGTAISTVYSRIFYFVFFTTFFRAVAKYYMEKEGWL